MTNSKSLFRLFLAVAKQNCHDVGEGGVGREVWVWCLMVSDLCSQGPWGSASTTSRSAQRGTSSQGSPSQQRTSESEPGTSGTQSTRSSSPGRVPAPAAAPGPGHLRGVCKWGWGCAEHGVHRAGEVTSLQNAALSLELSPN